MCCGAGVAELRGAAAFHLSLCQAPLLPGAEETGVRGEAGATTEGRVTWGEGLFLGAGRSFRAEPLPGRDEAVGGACGEGEAAAAALLGVAGAAGQLILILGGL